jgi:uncharacterized protein YegP (UPF0339 family)
MASRYVLHQNLKGSYYFTLVTHSGQVLLTSGVYSEKDRALRSISLARHRARHKENFQIITEEDGKSYFVLSNDTYDVLAESELFTDRESLQKGIYLVKGNTHGARLEDTTVPPPPPNLRNGKRF